MWAAGHRSDPVARGFSVPRCRPGDGLAFERARSPSVLNVTEPEHLDLVLGVMDRAFRSEDFFDVITAAIAERVDLDPLPIAEAAEQSGVSAHTLRYYERVGLVTVDRDAAGNRRYDTDAFERVVLVTRLRASGMPIATIRRYIDLLDGPDGAAGRDERLRILTQHRESIRHQVAELLISLAVTDYKIARYDELHHGGTL